MRLLSSTRWQSSVFDMSSWVYFILYSIEYCSYSSWSLVSANVGCRSRTASHSDVQSGLAYRAPYLTNGSPMARITSSSAARSPSENVLLEASLVAWPAACTNSSNM